MHGHYTYTWSDLRASGHYGTHYLDTWNTNTGHVSRHLRLWWLRIYLIGWILAGGAFQPTDVKRGGRCVYAVRLCIQTFMCVSIYEIWVSHFGPGPIDRLFIYNDGQNPSYSFGGGMGVLQWNPSSSKKPTNSHLTCTIWVLFIDLQWQALWKLLIYTI